MWYFIREGEQLGPVPEEQIRRMTREGSLKRDDLVWQEGMMAWQPASEVPGLEFPVQAPPPPPVAPPPAPYQYAPPPPQYVAAPPPQYPVPSPQYASGLAGAGADIPNYLPWAIVTTLCCCLPGGIVSIVYASKANSAKAMGDLGAAQAAANQAKTWLIVSVVGGLLISVLYTFLIAIGESF